MRNAARIEQGNSDQLLKNYNIFFFSFSFWKRNSYSNHDFQRTLFWQKELKTDLGQFASRRSTDGPYADNLDVDVLIVGAGFGGTYMLYQMGKEGYKTVLYDAGSDFGGVWHFNAYPCGSLSTFFSFYLKLIISQRCSHWYRGSHLRIFHSGVL